MKKKFTLIELIIVIITIGVLAAMALPKVTGIVQDARISTMINDKEVLEKTILLYYQKYDKLPLLNDDQELIVLNDNIQLTKLVKAEEVVSEDAATIYTSLQETLKHYDDEEEYLYRIDINEIKDSLSKKLKYGYKKTEKDFYIYSTKTNNVYYYDLMRNGENEIQHNEFNTKSKESELVLKKKSITLNENGNVVDSNEILISNSSFDLGDYHTMKIRNDGKLYVFGRNTYGQLGIGNIEEQTTPQLVSLPNEEIPISVSLGGNHSIVLTDKGNIYTWGNNNRGQLGIGNKINQSTPQLVNLPNGIKPKSIFAKDSVSMLLGDDGNLYSWGYNCYGQLGIGSTLDKSTPQLINLPNGIKPKSIFLGKAHSMIIGDDGNLYSWGKNDNGQLGIGNMENQLTPQLVNLPNGIKPKSISLGGFYSMMIGTDDNLYTWGYNCHGQLGIGNTLDQSTPQLVNLPNEIKPKLISAGYIHSLLLGSDGNLYSWGRNYRHSLGLNNSNDQNIPQLVNLENEIKIKNIYSNFLNSMIINENGDIFVWGANDYGQLGIGNKIDQSTPMKLELK